MIEEWYSKSLFQELPSKDERRRILFKISAPGTTEFAKEGKNSWGSFLPLKLDHGVNQALE